MILNLKEENNEGIKFIKYNKNADNYFILFLVIFNIFKVTDVKIWYSGYNMSIIPNIIDSNTQIHQKMPIPRFKTYMAFV